MNNKPNFNIIILSYSEENSKKFANELLKNKLYNKDIWQMETQEGIFNGYVRYPGVIPTFSPSGPTDCIICFIKNENEINNKEIKHEIGDYFKKRKGIPLKICNMENYISTDHIFLDSNSIELFRNIIFEKMVNLENIMRAAFKDIDTKNSGYIDSKEIMELCNKLNFVRLKIF